MIQNKNPEINASLDKILLQRLEELKESANSEIIGFPSVFKKICRNFSITKEECWSILFDLRDRGHIDIFPYHGIKINGQKNRNTSGKLTRPA